MLDHIRVFSADAIWRQILGDLGAIVCDEQTADVNIDTLGLVYPINAIELKAAILAAIDDGALVRQIFGRDIVLSDLQKRIVKLLYKSGGMGGADLRRAMGYAPGAVTHTIDTAIYQMRRVYGRDIIQNKNGVYVIGQL